MKIFDLKRKRIFNEIEISERKLSEIFLRNWKFIFNNISLIKNEFHLKGQVRDSETGGRIDFFGYNEITHKFVIVEIKKNYDKNIRSQIYDYADFIEDNFDIIYFKSKELLNHIKPNKDSFELILISKKFKRNDYSRINRFEHPTKLITYRYFENYKLILETYDQNKDLIKHEKKENLPNPINIQDNDQFLNNFWFFFSNSIKAEKLIANKDYRIIGPNLIVRINPLYDKYQFDQLDKNQQFLTLIQLKELLMSMNVYKGRKKAVKFGKHVSSAYIFDLLSLKNKYNI